MISIIVPFYCTKKEYFDKCMTSLLSDRDADIEVLIVDDGSSEEYKSSLLGYTEDRRVRVFFENHCGVSNARNVGIRESKGEWLMFVDSDDYLEEGFYKILNSMTWNTDADFFFFNGYGDRYGYSIKNKFFLKEDVDYGDTLEKKCMVMSSGLSLGRTPQHLKCFYTLGSPCSKLINANYIRKKNIVFDSGVTFAEDTLFSLSLIMNAEHIYYVDCYLYHYFLNAQSVTGKFRQGLSNEVDAFFEKVFSFMNKNGIRDKLEESYYIRAFLEAQRCIRQEFFHKDNPKKGIEKQREAREFLSKEPYNRALHADYPYLNEKACRIVSELYISGNFGVYMQMYGLMSKIRRVLHK